MKKIVYLTAIALAMVNVSCASLFGSVCNCSCNSLDCTCKGHRTLTPEQLARQDSINAAQLAQEKARRASLDSLLSIDYNSIVVPVYEEQTPQRFVWLDDEVINTDPNEIIQFFKSSKQSTDGSQDFVHKKINTSVKSNECYFYFTVKDGVAQSLHLVVHFYADDSVNFNKLRLTADGFKYEYTPSTISRTRDGNYYMENFDDVITPESKDFFAALAHCKTANILLLSEGGVNHRLFLTSEELERFKHTYELFRLLGGKVQ